MVPGEHNQIVPVHDMCATSEETNTSLVNIHYYVTIKDMTNMPDSIQVPKFLFLPNTTTAGQLILEVAKLNSLDSDKIDLFLQKQSFSINIQENDSRTLEELDFVNSKENLLFLFNKREKPDEDKVLAKFNADDYQDCSTNDIAQPSDKQSIKFHKKNIAKMTKSELENFYCVQLSELSENRFDQRKFPQEASSSQDSSSNQESVSNQETSTNSGIDSFYSNSYSNAVSRHDTGFVGLVNQAMTCYLNSLLQTLFMTPEFRNTLYRWEFDGTEEEGSKSIPYQLQRLFLQLQTSGKAAVGTTELTTSFGWDSSEAWQQHDVQELCRVMFDALEQKFKNTQQADLISRLYEGKLKDYVKCLECGYESAREDTFLDVPLVVRPFGSSQAYASVGEALQAFVTPEILQESNQYFCEHCNKKCDAHKGLKFLKFPYLLTLQLKRFDFDPVTMHRIKLNDRVSFPEILNLNDFIKSENNSETCDDGDTTDSGSALDDEGIGYASGYKTGCSLSPEAFSDNDLPDDDEGIDVSPHGPPLENNHELCINERNLKKSMEKGPYVYELFSIMVHSGSANGGHYYAYIKSFKHGEWYCFNDAQVTRITYDDIQKTYGGGPSRGYYSSAYSSSSNAYMLMYRQIDKQKNAECMSPEEFPDHIKALLQHMVEQEERDRLQKELDRSSCKIKLFCRHPVTDIMLEMKLKVHKDCTLAEATQTAHSIMPFLKYVPLDCCRLVKYDEFNDYVESSFDPSTEETFGELLGGVKSSYKFDLLLEIKKPHEKFQEYKPGGVTIKIVVVDLEREHVQNTNLTVRCHLSSTVQELRTQVADALGVDGSKMRMALLSFTTVLLTNPTSTLDSEGFFSKGDKLFIEYQDQEDAEKPFIESKFYRVLDIHKNTICLRIALPKIDQAIIDRLRLHECDSTEDPADSSSEDEDDKDSEGRPWAPVLKEASCSKSKIRALDFDEKYCSESHLPRKNESNSSETDDRYDSDELCAQLRACVERRNQRVKQKENCDEGLGDSETGATSSSIDHIGQQAAHSDQSEDSSLTDSERTLVGDELSPRNNSPDVTGSELDSEPLNVDPLIAEVKAALPDSEVSCYSIRKKFTRKFRPSELDDQVAENTKNIVIDFKNSNLEKSTVKTPEASNYFAAFTHFDSETGEKMLRVYIDKRMTLKQLKKNIEPHVGIGADCFKIYRVYSSNQTMECTRLTDNLMSYGDDSLLQVKLGRALRKGEYMVKIYLLRINDFKFLRYLTDCVIVKNMTVQSLKEEILPELREKCDLNIPLNRCRLRKKSWLSPGQIYLDHQTFESFNANSTNEMFLEELSGPEPVTSSDQMALFSRMWHPSTFTLDSFKEVIIEHRDAETLRKALSEISQVPEEFIEFAKGTGTFPFEVSLLNIDKELEWQMQNPSNLKSNPYHFKLLGFTDGDIVYYRDNREELKKLSDDERRIIQNKENARSNKNLKTSYSPRKEKALKFYTVDSNPKTLKINSLESNQSSVQNKSSQSISTAPNSHQQDVPDTSLCSINPELD